MESSERNILIFFVVALALVVGIASFALRVPTVHAPPVNVEDLPLARDHAAYGPEWAACAEAGGTPKWERVSECIQSPSVRDVCGFGVPCFFTDGNGGMSCNDAKASYCACDADSQCPKGYECPHGGDRCEPSASVGSKPPPDLITR